MRPYVIEIRNLNVWYGSLHVLKNVSIAVPKNTVVAIIGPSGSGKSTLLRTINRLIDLIPNARVSGEVRVFGQNILNGFADIPKLRRAVGMVFQMPNPFPHLSIYENVAIGPKYNRLAKSREELDRIVREALINASLWDEVKDRLDDKSTNLSGGQQQRLCLARALANRPKILLLDEPTANIDPFSTQKIENSLKELKKNLTIVLVTHSIKQVLRVADYAIFMENGRVVASKSVRELSTSNEPLVRAYMEFSA